MSRKSIHKIILFLLIPVFYYPRIFAEQIDIDRIEKMPNKPNPYQMRDWKSVAKGYDSLVFDITLTGDYLPFVWIDGNTVNYPNHSRFGLHSYVGTFHPNSAEAITVLPAVVGATLVGIDKRDKNGIDWVLMCEEFFNKRPEENVYLNNFITSSGNDWWYDTMPNIFFYQLYDLYPNTGDFDYQFATVADRWFEAVKAMGGSAASWRLPDMNYRAWKLSTMTPLDVGVREPEAAGAIAWILYNAYVKTGDEKYRIGAEWAMEFLNTMSSNPSYELQLPYGVYTAARMNAEIGTDYNIKKIVNWCFDPSNNVRNWGATLGSWGGYDCYGLIGEAKFEGYAFAMNGFEQVGALVPMVRYDDRFARAVGKWVLNCANAYRLFYPNYLPDENQDNEEWTGQYDPESYIAYEAIRENALYTGISPYATGDAIKGGWARTNLGLYGSSHVGIFGGIIDTTNVEMILRLDALKTDYFHDRAYTTYLYFNPHDENKIVEIDVGNNFYDLYDAVSNSFLEKSVSGTAWFTIPADNAVLVVVTPAGGTITYDFDKMLIDSVVVDYQSGQYIENYPPRIKSLVSESVRIVSGDSTIVYCAAADRDLDTLYYLWNVSGGTISGTGSNILWKGPDVPGLYAIMCIVDDGRGLRDSARVNIEVVEFINHAPIIDSLIAVPRKIETDGKSELYCYAHDPDGDSLLYYWTSQYSNLENVNSKVFWTAPANQGFYFVRCRVEDGRGGQASDSISIIVVDPLNTGTGVPIAYYPFNGNANDESGFDNHGIVHGAVLVEDRFGEADRAYYFNGTSDFIQVDNHASLNFQDEISVSFWMRIDEFFSSRESYTISHGNWEKRWKISIIPEKKVRWTVKTDKGIKDLDSKTLLSKDIFYNVTGIYDRINFEIYINGVLDNKSTFSGSILKTSIDLTIGQVLPNNSSYNFKGVLDDIRIYNYAISVEEIQNIYNEKTDIQELGFVQIPENNFLFQNYPNPFNNETIIKYYIKDKNHLTLNIYNIIGQKICTLVQEEKEPGYYSVQWDGTNSRGQFVPSGIYFYQMKIGDFLRFKKLVILR